MSNITEQMRKSFSSLSASTLMKLVQIRADEAYSGSFTVFVNEGSYVVAFGLPALGIKQAARLESYPTLKAALVTALVEEPFFSDAESEFVTELPN